MINRRSVEVLFPSLLCVGSLQRAVQHISDQLRTTDRATNAIDFYERRADWLVDVNASKLRGLCDLAHYFTVVLVVVVTVVSVTG